MANKARVSRQTRTLSELRKDIRTFRHIGQTPFLDDRFELDVIAAALRRLDPAATPADIRMNAGIIRHMNLTDFAVTEEDIREALEQQYARQSRLDTKASVYARALVSRVMAGIGAMTAAFNEAPRPASRHSFVR